MRNHTTATDPTVGFAGTTPGTVPDAATATGDRPRRGSRLVVVAGTTATALLLWLVAGPVLGINLDASQTPGSAAPVPVTASSVVVSSVAAGLLGWTLLAALERVSARGVTIWRWVAGGVALLSLGGPLTLADSGGGTVVLTLLHVVVGGILLIALPTAGTASAGRTGASRTDTHQEGVNRAGVST